MQLYRLYGYCSFCVIWNVGIRNMSLYWFVREKKCLGWLHHLPIFIFLSMLSLSNFSPPSSTLCRFLSLELLRHYAHARLHLHLGGGPLVPSHSRNSPGAGKRGEGQDGVCQHCWTRGQDWGMDRGWACVWTWKLFQQSSKGLPTPDWQVFYYFSRVLFFL